MEQISVFKIAEISQQLSRDKNLVVIPWSLEAAEELIKAGIDKDRMKILGSVIAAQDGYPTKRYLLMTRRQCAYYERQEKKLLEEAEKAAEVKDETGRTQEG